MLLGFRPGAELLAVVAEHDDRVGDAIGNPAQVVDRLVRRREGNQVAQPLAAGKDGEQPAVVFGQVVAVQLVGRQAGILKWKSSRTVYSMPASTRSLVNDCSHTRSGIHIPCTRASRRDSSQWV